ncbi:MAG: hypothetical protein L0Y73_00130 [Candidatus Aminicenantes bacterium]|nr:hypothetical protein [Candidatus Aminicenantes bacterium]
MTHATNEKEDLKKIIGSRLKHFRTKVMKLSRVTFSEYAGEIGIPAGRLKIYEAGEEYPAYIDLVKMSRHHGLNLNWLFYENGGMFFAREKDMEEMIRRIEDNKTGHYEHYKMLLKSMQAPEMEDFIFYLHGLVVDLLAKLGQKIVLSRKNMKLLFDMIEDVDYQWPPWPHHAEGKSDYGSPR